MANSDDMGDLGNFREDPNAKKEKALSDMDDMGALTKVVDPADEKKRISRAERMQQKDNPPAPGEAAAGDAPAPEPSFGDDELSKLEKFTEEEDLKPIEIDAGPGPIETPGIPAGSAGSGGDAGGIAPIDTGGAVPTDFLPKDGAPTEEKKGPTRRLADGTEVPLEVAKHVFDAEKNRLKKGDYIDLLHKVPSLKYMYIACGWGQAAVETDRVDVDMSLFLLDKNGQTRADGDFIFYNNQRACEGAIKHMGDNRAGMGDGDNETIFVDFNGIPFDVMKIVVAISIYDEKRDGLHFGGVNTLYVRLVNKEDNFEILRLPVEDQTILYHNTFVPLTLVREGPKWFVEGTAKPGKETLGGIAKSYGIIVQEDTG